MGLRLPQSLKIFAASIFCGAISGLDSDCRRTASGHRYGSNQQLQQRQVSKRLQSLQTADHPRNAARNDARV